MTSSPPAATPPLPGSPPQAASPGAVSPLLASLRAHVPIDAQEARSQARIVGHVEAGGALFDRRRFDGHLTGSAFVLDAAEERLFLIHHRKLKLWLQPGGHGDPGETEALAVALREAREETAIEGLTLHPAAPAPFDLDVHAIPARGDELSHEHLDIRYLLVAPPGAVARHDEAEALGSTWIPIVEAAREGQDESIARPARKILALLARRG
jgi:8-oxo-dGTP pyrophosphatase MutT (NUDIX family)